MADNSVVTEAGNFALQFARMAASMRCAMPGTIESFDYATQRASVIPGVKLKIVLGKDVKYVELPVIPNVPVVIPYGFQGKVALTHPIDSGDPCMLIFSDRAIDNYLQSGKAEMPGTTESEDTTSPRAHHLSDAMCIPGLVADPQVLPEWNKDHIELRDFDRKHFISLGADGITISDSEATWHMEGGRVSLDAPNGVETITDSNYTVQAVGNISELANGNVGIHGNQNVSVTADGLLNYESTGPINYKTPSEVTYQSANYNMDSGGNSSQTGTSTDGNGRNSTEHTHGGVQGGNSTSGPTNG